jgi:hypothetical protein
MGSSVDSSSHERVEQGRKSCSMRILRSWLLLGPNPVLRFDYFIARDVRLTVRSLSMQSSF